MSQVFTQRVPQKTEFEVLYLDSSVVVIDKPEGFHVHRPENPKIRVGPEWIVLQQLKQQLGRYLYPVHRLDAATSGCLLFAFDSESAHQVSKQLNTELFQKEYTALVRGWTESHARIDTALATADRSMSVEALTELERIRTMEIPHTVSRYPSARYSLVRLKPHTGRYHQIRRHLNHISHPIIGDSTHGDRHHNHYFRDTWKLPGLFLRSHSLSFRHPQNPEQRISVTCELNTSRWLRLQELFNEFATTGASPTPSE